MCSLPNATFNREDKFVQLATEQVNCSSPVSFDPYLCESANPQDANVCLFVELSASHPFMEHHFIEYNCYTAKHCEELTGA